MTWIPQLIIIHVIAVINELLNMSEWEPRFEMMLLIIRLIKFAITANRVTWNSSKKTHKMFLYCQNIQRFHNYKLIKLETQTRLFNRATAVHKEQPEIFCLLSFLWSSFLQWKSSWVNITIYYTPNGDTNPWHCLRICSCHYHRS